MTRLLALAAFLLASTAAQAQYTFEYGGRTIHIDPDRGTVSIPGVYDNTGRKSKRARSTDQDSAHKQPQAPQEAKVQPQAPAAPAPAEAVTPPQAAAPVAPAANPPAPPPTTTANAPTDTVAPPPPVPPAPPPPAQQDAALQPAPATAPSVVVLPAPVAPQPPPPAPPPAPQQTATAAPVPAPPPAVRDPNSPVGVWLTEEKEGKVRIEQCGANLCGYSVDSKSNLNGEQVLINMKPGKDQKWSGRILDPNTGSTYDSTIALKGPDTLRVQGCAFGGMFCGGQTWSRVN
ncbi:MAG TPA: DUF2147 domain-containing protein [Bradyrhizobium sp.]|nr:DUF2147 domain-containing protein [Bradyrhizobium sp.]